MTKNDYLINNYLKNKMSLTVGDVDKVVDFFQYIYTYIGKLECIEIFGDKDGNHIWHIKEKYTFGENILWDVEHFYEDLDPHNKLKLIHWYKREMKKRSNVKT